MSQSVGSVMVTCLSSIVDVSGKAHKLMQSCDVLNVFRLKDGGPQNRDICGANAVVYTIAPSGPNLIMREPSRKHIWHNLVSRRRRDDVCH